MSVVIALAGGLIFGLGLIISGMSNPAKVIGFLDLAGSWDPSLALVMVGAIGVGLVAFRLAGRRQRTLLGEPLQLPGPRPIDRSLVVGSALFGIGWGLAGICPGPGFVLLGAGVREGVIFVLALLAGMGMFELQQRSPLARRCAR